MVLHHTNGTRRTMGLSLREAAREANISKSTVLRAIQRGRLSAGRTDDGGYSIEPSELFRAYPPRPASNGAAPDTSDSAHQVIDLLKQQLADTREDRDRWRAQCEQITRAIADRRPWWRKLTA
jgi:hypothetical protein